MNIENCFAKHCQFFKIEYMDDYHTKSDEFIDKYLHKCDIEGCCEAYGGWENESNRACAGNYYLQIRCIITDRKQVISKDACVFPLVIKKLESTKPWCPP